MGHDQEDLSPQDKRKIQKLRLRVRHLDEELIQAKDLKAEYDYEFDEMHRQLRIALGLEKEKDDPPPSPENKKKKCQVNVDPGANAGPSQKADSIDNDYRHESDNASASAPAWMKKAYKQIAMKTHPDRISQDDSLSPYEVAEYKRLFETAKTAIQEQNGGDIAYVAEQLNINSGIPATMRISLLYARAEKIKNTIQKIYRTPAWLWCEAHDNKATRKKILESYCQVFRYKIPSAEFINKFLDKLEAK